MRVRAHVRVCVSCCVNTLLLMPHTSYIYDATHDKHILAVAATIGFSFFFFCCKEKGIVDQHDCSIPFVVDPRNDISGEDLESK